MNRMNRPLIRVATAEAKPYIVFNKTSKAWGGIFVALLDTVCKHLEFDCLYFSPATRNLSTDETLDGVMGALTNRTADVALSAIGISYNRTRKFHFIDSFFRRSYMVLVHQDHLLSVPASEFFANALSDMISNKVWTIIVSLILAFFGLGIIIDFFQAMIFGMGLGVEGIDDFEPNEIDRWPFSKTIFLTTWLLYTQIILSTITGQLPAIFTLDQPKQLPFYDVKSLLESNYSVYGTPTAIEMLKISKIPSHSELSAKMQLLPKISQPGLTRYQQQIQMAKTEKSALIVNQESALEMAFVSCDMVVAVDHLDEVRVAALLLSKYSPVRETLERGYAETKQNGILQAGLISFEHFIRTSTLTKTVCYRRKIPTKPEPRLHALRQEDLSFLIWILGGSLTASLATFLFEVTFFGFGRSIISVLRQKLRPSSKSSRRKAR